jgi:diguanylate cyclase (GGDEF)-like protein
MARTRARSRGAPKRNLGITSRFVLVLLVLVVCLTGMAAAGFAGLRSARNSLNTLYEENVVKTREATDLVAHLDDAAQSVLESLLAKGAAARRPLTNDLVSTLSPAIEVGIANLLRLNTSYPDEERATVDIAEDWGDFRKLWTNESLGRKGETRSAQATELTNAMDLVTTDADDLVHFEGDQAQLLHQRALSTYDASVRSMILILVLGLLAGVGVVLWLIRGVLPRTLAYSRFAARIAQGDFSQRLDPSGADELAQLGRTLDDVAQRRQAEDRYDRTQLEFTDTLQLTGDEREAHDLLTRHLERSIPDSSVTVLNRNNSADRLEAVTAIVPDSPLRLSLDGAAPRACLAIRMAHPHSEQGGEDALLSCEICSVCPGLSTCAPLLVGGEVIGSVLVNHPEPLGEDSERRIQESVRQAAPVLANLRNLAVAEVRAATDALTGLPNRRSLENTLKRMVAQAARTQTPLSALMLDLDHFKQINDRYGHGKGDDVLAAVGAALLEIVRQSDFVGRYGGEEFLALLPATGEDGAQVIGEKIRNAIAEILVPGLESAITVSVGIAVLPDHAFDAETLAQAADRALYSAKSRGRNRVEMAASGPPTSEIGIAVASKD